MSEQQMGLFDKERGMALALTPDAQEEWRQAFRSAVLHFPIGWMFTSEDVLAKVGLPRGEPTVNGNNAVGAMMNGLARRKVIGKTTRRVMARRQVSHGREIPVWVRL